jgi:hypothetical protein
VLRGIEGAAQRVQEDTMRFSSTTEDMGGSFINSVLTLIAFLPVLWKLGEHVTRLPLVGVVPHALVVAALVWSAFGTVFLAAIGIRLPGLNFRNQRVEAAYRKELVYGEDDPTRVQPPGRRPSRRASRLISHGPSAPERVTRALARGSHHPAVQKAARRGITLKVSGVLGERRCAPGGHARAQLTAPTLPSLSSNG